MIKSPGGGSGSGSTGTVTSVGVTSTGSTLTVTGSPVTTAGSINVELVAAQAVPLLIPSVVWASRGSGTFTGQLKRITDIGPANVGTLFVWDNTASVWKLTAPAVLQADFTVYTAGTLDTSEHILSSFTFPAGLLSAGRVLNFKLGFGKDGTTDTLTGRLRIGTAGTTSDGAVSSISTAIMIAANRSGVITTILATNIANTTLRHAGLLSFNQGFDAVNAQATVYPADLTVADFTSNALIASFSTTMSGSTNHGQVNQTLIELWP